MRQELAQRRLELLDLVKQDPSGWPAMQGKVKEISELQARLEEEVLRFFLSLKKELKPEQNAAFLVLLEHRLTPLLGGRRSLGPGHRSMRPGMGRGMGPDCFMPGGPGAPPEKAEPTPKSSQ